MLLPTLSVTLIGLIAALIIFSIRRGRPFRTLLLGIAGAWIGFLLGAVCGVVFDVVAQTGVYVPIVGHLAATFGSFAALSQARV